VLVEMAVMFLLVLICVTIGAWPVQAQEAEDYGEVVGEGKDTDPFTDGFGPLPLAYRCPDEPHPDQGCAPGMWYIGSLFGDTAFDLAIKHAADARRYKMDWDTCEEEKRRIETGMGIQLDARTKQFEKAELRAYRAEKAQPILFGVGVGLGVAATILIVALVERTSDEPAAMEPAFGVRW